MRFFFNNISDFFNFLKSFINFTRQFNFFLTFFKLKAFFITTVKQTHRIKQCYIKFISLLYF